MSKKHQIGRTTQMLRQALSCGVNADSSEKILIVGADWRHMGVMADTLTEIAAVQAVPLIRNRRHEFLIESTGAVLRFVTWSEYRNGQVVRGAHYTNVFIDHYCWEVQHNG